jgi:hypothetical protein
MLSVAIRKEYIAIMHTQAVIICPDRRASLKHKTRTLRTTKPVQNIVDNFLLGNGVSKQVLRPVY